MFFGCRLLKTIELPNTIRIPADAHITWIFKECESLPKEIKDKTLSLLGFNHKEDYILYNSIAKTIAQMIDVDRCHIFLYKDNPCM